MGPFSKFFKQTDVMLGAGLLGIVGMLILPVPHWFLDVGFVFAIAISVIILLTCVNITDPLQFNIFPSLLLITTLFRLSLSVAATKLILGTGDGGKVIETFGQFVMGGDFIVGFVAFLILVIVQFVVITNGSGRVSEVAARFTLDAMPGRQMAIDADLAAGLINEEMAKERRKAVKMEADFYGAMDGASKFVKGDAIAAILIIVVNIIGGFLIGFMKGEGSALDILRNYSLLSVGEGLVSQISALLISTSSGLLVTRAGQENTMSSNIIKQLFDQPRAIQFSGIALFGFGLVPGFPSILFFTVGGSLIYLSRVLFQEQQLLPATTPKSPEMAKNQEPEIPRHSPEAALPFVNIDPLEIEIGYGLTHLADNNIGGDLSERIIMTRKQIALEIGYIMPSVRVRDSIQLLPYQYTIKIRGEEIAKGELQPKMLMALEGDNVIEKVAGTVTIDPVFGIQAVWIEPALRSFAEQNGYTVIDPSAIISTHLGEVVKKHAFELLSRQEVQALIDNLKATSPAVVEELIPNVMQIGEVQKVLQHLLKENIPIKDLNTILEVLADYGPRYKDPDQLGELARSAISRTIIRQYTGSDHTHLACVTFDGTLERALTDQIQQVGVSQQIILDPEVQRKLIVQINNELAQSKATGKNPVLLCSSTLRLPLRRLLDRNDITAPVLAYNEVTSSTNVDFIGTIHMV